MIGRLLHIATRRAWGRARAAGAYFAEDFAREGYHHGSETWQVREVADRLFRGRGDLVLLEIEESKLSSRVRRENLEGAEELYPHVYGPIDLEAVVATHPLEPDAEGRLVLPPQLGGEGRRS